MELDVLSRFKTLLPVRPSTSTVSSGLATPFRPTGSADPLKALDSYCVLFGR